MSSGQVGANEVLIGLLRQFAAAAASNPTAIRPLRKLLRDNLATLAVPAVRLTYETGGPIGAVLAREIRRSDNLALLADLYNHLHNGLPQSNGMPLFPSGNVTFGQVAIAVGEKVLDAGLKRSDSVGLHPENVVVFTNLAGWYATLGRHEEARRVARKALRYFGKGKTADDPAKRAAYASALAMFATSLRQLGMEQQGAKAADEVVGVYRSLVKDDPDGYGPDLARCLVNWAGSLHGTTDTPRKVTAYEEAVALYRHHQKPGSQRYRPELCQALTGFANILLESGAMERAEAAAAEAVAIATDLATRQDQSFRQHLVMAAMNHALVLQRCGRAAQAEPSVGVAIQHARVLSRESETAYRPLLAHCLAIAANVLNDAGQPDNAYASLAEAIALSPEEPAGDHARTQLATWYFNLAMLAEETRRDAVATTAAAKARAFYSAAGRELHTRSLDALNELEARIASPARSIISTPAANQRLEAEHKC